MLIGWQIGFPGGTTGDGSITPSNPAYYDGFAIHGAGDYTAPDTATVLTIGFDDTLVQVTHGKAVEVVGQYHGNTALTPVEANRRWSARVDGSGNVIVSLSGTPSVNEGPITVKLVVKDL